METIIPGLLPEESTRLLSIFRSDEAVTEVILYGSRAKGTYREGSDIDLTVKGCGLNTAQLMEWAGKIDDLLLPYEVDLSIFSHIDNIDLIEHIQRVGKVVYLR
jgi:uncharacterized protein